MNVCQFCRRMWKDDKLSRHNDVKIFSLYHFYLSQFWKQSVPCAIRWESGNHILTSHSQSRTQQSILSKIKVLIMNIKSIQMPSANAPFDI